MTKRIGNKDIAHQRSKAEKKEIKQANRAREAVRRAQAEAKYRNQARNGPPPASAAA
jgi:hypothetical protein